jgi:glucose/arabinose dehydrogenase
VRYLTTGAVVLIIGAAVFAYFYVSKNVTERSEYDLGLPTSQNTTTEGLTVIAEGLDTPWGIAFLPNNEMLVTERAGRVRLIKNGSLQEEPLATLTSVKEIGEGGLLGIAVPHNFSTNNSVYLYYTYSESGGNTMNRVVKMTYQDRTLEDEKIIVDKIPGASNHNGGRIKFGPDGYLYITTGDASDPSLAQDRNSLAGKILRVVNDSQVSVYSYGHRNPQGIAWDNNGQLYSTEHGQSTQDEFNKIQIGKNYGWPEIRGDQSKFGMERPMSHSGDDTWAPSGAAYYQYSDNEYSIFFGGLRGQALYEMNFKDGNSTLRTHLKGEYGRIREVILGPDNFVYISTSNKDGRGNPAPSDDRIIRINPKNL